MRRTKSHNFRIKYSTDDKKTAIKQGKIWRLSCPLISLPARCFIQSRAICCQSTCIEPSIARQPTITCTMINGSMQTSSHIPVTNWLSAYLQEHLLILLFSHLLLFRKGRGRLSHITFCPESSGQKTGLRCRTALLLRWTHCASSVSTRWKQCLQASPFRPKLGATTHCAPSIWESFYQSC